MVCERDDWHSYVFFYRASDEEYCSFLRYVHGKRKGTPQGVTAAAGSLPEPFIFLYTGRGRYPASPVAIIHHLNSQDCR